MANRTLVNLTPAGLDAIAPFRADGTEVVDVCALALGLVIVHLIGGEKILMLRSGN